ncbi:protein sneaky-like isoform X2 [Paramacrobiotus metropolitanus]|uniref:protein sneaky-like isoform X2 n=1 Tax=Paramacrobiotus metropolitanus TaxID=2943436 RepID=UPI0024458E3C|nr:protein sneaky-like isoform X2 [Paramacrobiotus metropolitanus]
MDHSFREGYDPWEIAHEGPEPEQLLDVETPPGYDVRQSSSTDTSSSVYGSVNDRDVFAPYPDVEHDQVLLSETGSTDDQYNRAHYDGQSMHPWDIPLDGIGGHVQDVIPYDGPRYEVDNSITDDSITTDHEFLVPVEFDAGESEMENVFYDGSRDIVSPFNEQEVEAEQFEPVPANYADHNPTQPDHGIPVEDYSLSAFRDMDHDINLEDDRFESRLSDNSIMVIDPALHLPFISQRQKLAETFNPSSPHYRYKDELIDIDGMIQIGGKIAFWLEKLSLRWKRFFHGVFPPLFALVYSRQDEYSFYKALLGFPLGVGLGLLFYYAVVDRLNLPAFLRFMIGAMTVTTLALGYARSIRIRCLAWLIFPCFCGKSGRSVLMTMAVGALLTGPVSNTMSNFKESVRCVTCMTEMMINITLTRFELTGRPIFNIVKGFVGDKRMDSLGRKIRSALSPVRKEVESEKETREAEIRAQRLDAEMRTDRNAFLTQIEKQNAVALAKADGGTKSKAFKIDTCYLKKLDYRCNDIWSLAVDTCKKSFANAWDNCLKAIPVIGYLLCWPTKLDFFCYIVKLFPSPIKCDSNKILNQGFGGAYGEADDAGKELQEGTHVALEYKGLSVSKQIERRRRSKNKPSLVPLKKLEGKVLIESTKWKLLPEEKQEFSKGSMRLAINAITFCVIFLFDRLIYEILSIVARHSYIVYTQKGVHDISLEIQGGGVLAKLVRKILKGFHERTEINRTFDNLKCLPYPTLTPPSAYWKVFGTVGVIWLLIYLEAYGLRLRSWICSFFYPKREKQRILHLYNDTLKKRAGYARSIRHHVRRLARQRNLQMQYDMLSALREQCPYLCFWLKWLQLGKKRCTACKEKEDDDFYHCPTPGCSFEYCQSCWDDLLGHCYGCVPEREDESSLSEGEYELDKAGKDND